MAWTSAPAKTSDTELTTGKHKVWTRIDPPFSCKWKIKQLNRTCRIKLHVVSVCAVTFAGGVQQCSLERDGLHVVQVFLDGHLDSEAGVRVHVRERQQVCGAHEEVPVESVDGQTCSQREIKVQFKTQ